MAKFIGTVKYIFSGDGWTDEWTRLVQKDYPWYYGRFADVFNDHIGEINDEWYKLYHEDSMDDDMEIIYNHFVTAKMQKYLIKLNMGEFFDSGWIVSENPETTLCRVYLEEDPTSYVDFDIQIDYSKEISP